MARNRSVESLVNLEAEAYLLAICVPPLQTRVKVTFTAAARQNLGFQYTWATWTGYKYRRWSWTALAFTYLNSSLSSRFLQGYAQGQPEPLIHQTAAVCQPRGRKAWNQGKTHLS